MYSNVGNADFGGERWATSLPRGRLHSHVVVQHEAVSMSCTIQGPEVASISAQKHKSQGWQVLRVEGCGPSIDIHVDGLE